MSTVTLEQLRAYEAKLVKALGDPTRTVFYDDFKRENRPISEIKSALAAVRDEIAAHPDYVAPQTQRSSIRRARITGAY